MTFDPWWQQSGGHLFGYRHHSQWTGPAFDQNDAAAWGAVGVSPCQYRQRRVEQPPYVQTVREPVYVVEFADPYRPDTYFAPGALRRIAQRMALCLLCAAILVVLFSNIWQARLTAVVLFVAVAFEAAMHVVNFEDRRRTCS